MVNTFCFVRKNFFTTTKTGAKKQEIFATNTKNYFERLDKEHSLSERDKMVCCIISVIEP
jgi:hypothetical protein